MQNSVLGTTDLVSPFKDQIMQEEGSEMHSKIIDKTTTSKQMTKNELLFSSPTQIAHDLNESKNSEKISKPTTAKNKTISVRMSHPSESGSDTIDFLNRHELIPVPNGSHQTTYKSSSLHSTPTLAYHKDGHYFLKLLASEKARLLTMADQAERDMYVLTTSNSSNEIPDEIFGILRSVSGKTKLLVSQKLKQFEGLCHSNLNPTPDEKFPTTIEDLLGFWDMVNLQIEHIDSLFKELELIKANNWQPTKDTSSPFVPTGSKLIKKPVIKNSNNNVINSIKTSQNALMMAQKRDNQRKQLLELKRKNKTGTISSPIEIFVSDNIV